MKLPSLQNLPTLAAILGDSNLRLVDIGGRGTAMNPLVPLAPFAHYYTCEPDAEEAARLEVQLPQDLPWRTVTVMSEAIASREGSADLYLTHRPGMSSLLEPDPAVTGRYCIAGKFQVTSIARVPTLTLADAARRYGFEDACFLKIDTQGTELEILKSGSRLVDESLVGVFVETLFQPFYRGQSLFADVDTYLRQHGFSLFSLYRTMLRRAAFRPDVYSRRVIVWAHCLYLREPNALPEATLDMSARHVARLLGLALVFQQYDFVFELLDKARAERLFPEERWNALSQEVESFVAQQTRRLVRKSSKEGTADTVLARSTRDRQYRED